MPILPDEYARASAYDLLAAAARGHLAVDQRLIAALIAEPARTQPDLIRFSREDRAQDRVDLSLDLLYLFAAMPSPEAVPFLIGEMRRDLDDAAEDLIDLANRLGAPAAEALLDLFDETGRTHSEVLFVALAAGARGPRVDEAIAAIAAADPDDAGFLSEIAAIPFEAESELAPPEYPAEADPDLSLLPESEREEFLLSGSANLRRAAVLSYFGEDLSDRRRQQFIELGGADPDALVRGLAWEALRDETGNAPVLRAMSARMAVAVDPLERVCLASALAYHPDVEGVIEAIETGYSDPVHRAKALEAMWRSFDRRWVDRPPRHLDDPDIDVRRQAMLGVGYFQLRAEANRLEVFFEDPDLRDDAIYAYALAAPAEDNRFGLRQLEKRIEKLAGPLTEDEVRTLEDALGTRLSMAGRGGAASQSPAASPAVPVPPPAAKVGRNDPCPCGSGRKYKKCCGSAA
jgi:SEC-C motif